MMFVSSSCYLLFTNHNDFDLSRIKFIHDYPESIFEFVNELRELTTDEAEELFLKYYELRKYDSKFLRTEILENMLQILNLWKYLEVFEKKN